MIESFVQIVASSTTGKSKAKEKSQTREASQAAQENLIRKTLRSFCPRPACKNFSFQAIDKEAMR